MPRFFAFGCSFTRYVWPTWADIIGRSYDAKDYHNFGMIAAGNEFIFHQIMQAKNHYNFGPEDLILICWTNFAREDRYICGQWLASGNIFSQKLYPENWVRQWFDLRGALIKTSGWISAAMDSLDLTGCRHQHFSMMPMDLINIDDACYKDMVYQDIFDIYGVYYQRFLPSMVGHLFDSLPLCRNPSAPLVRYAGQDLPHGDNHPTPAQHLRYVDEVLIPVLDFDLLVDDGPRSWVNEWESMIRESRPFYQCQEVSGPEVLL